MRGTPTPPIDLAGGAARASARFAPGAPLDPRLVERLRGVCSAVEVAHSERAEHGRDWWPLAMIWAGDGQVPALPAAVVQPASSAEVAAVLALCHEVAVPVTAMAGRSGVCGGSVPVAGGVALDLCGLSGIVGVDDTSLLLDVRAGTFGDILEADLRRDHGVTLGHWPQSMALSTVGGWLACRSAGQYSTRYGKIEDMVIGLEVVLADGTTVRTGGRGPRAASGPDLNQLFVGSEGTLGVITEARLRVHPTPPAERRAAFAFETFAAGLDACRRILRRGATPAVLRLYDEAESARSLQTPGTNVLLVLDEGDAALIDGVFSVVEQECAGASPLDDVLVEHWLAHRNDTSGLQKAIDRGFVVDTCEVAARWSDLPGVHRAAIDALRKVEGTVAATCHQSHAYGDGACLYFTFAGITDDKARREAYYIAAWDAVTRAALESGATLSHHHGVGLHRARFMTEALGPAAMTVLERVKDALDPKAILNPGKLGLGAPPAVWP